MDQRAHVAIGYQNQGKFAGGGQSLGHPGRGGSAETGNQG